jgi:hypothetical protein
MSFKHKREKSIKVSIVECKCKLSFKSLIGNKKPTKLIGELK